MTRTKSATPNFDRITPQVCINAKLRRLHRLLNSVYMRKLKPFGLQGSMLSILFIIGKEQRINQKTIADRLVLDPSTMSRDLRKMLDNGWISIRKGKDSRHSELELTAKGYRLLEEVSPVWEKLHHSVEELLGTYHIGQIDTITNAIQSHLTKLDN
jgi:DNA-binding MarR family transcriptional regulator